MYTLIIHCDLLQGGPPWSEVEDFDSKEALDKATEELDEVIGGVDNYYGYQSYRVMGSDKKTVEVLRLPGDKVFLVAGISGSGDTCEVCGGTGLVDNEGADCFTCEGDGYLSNVWTYGVKDDIIEEVIASAKLINGRVEVEEAYKTAKAPLHSPAKAKYVYDTEEEAQVVCDQRNGGVA